MFSSGDFGPSAMAKHACSNTGRVVNAARDSWSFLSDSVLLSSRLSVDSSRLKYATSRS